MDVCKPQILNLISMSKCMLLLHEHAYSHSSSLKKISITVYNNLCAGFVHRKIYVIHMSKKTSKHVPKILLMSTSKNVSGNKYTEN